MPSASLTPDLIRHLLQPEAFPHPAESPELVETHISWVILAGEFAYKIKKPVALDFLDFSTLDLRRHFCTEELRLNHRFAPEIYLDVVPIGGSQRQPRVGDEPALEWAVCMRRFPADAGLDQRVPGGLVTACQLRRFGERLAKIHADAPIAEDPAYGSLASIRDPALDNFTSVQRDCTADQNIQRRIRRLREWTEHACRELAPVFAERLAAGCIRECHGDLHLGNIVCIEENLHAFDCLEFDPALRWIDVFSDVGFLLMDLWRLGRADLACAFLNRYLEVSNDYPGLATLRFYSIYRAMVRAKTTAVRIAQQGQGDLSAVGKFIEIAERAARRSRRPLLVICHGLSGSGKTWLSDRLVAALPAIRVRSDIVRRHLHGLSELQGSGAQLHGGIYGRVATAQTYEQVAANATLGLAAGLNVIVDATCLRRADRARLARVAESGDADWRILHCAAPTEVLEARVRRRRSAGTDASEAGIAVLHDQLGKAEPLSDAELGRTLMVDTDQEIAVAAIAAALCAGRPQPDRVS